MTAIPEVDARIAWVAGSHERAVERFYAQGGNADTEVHSGYLNFGLWEAGVGDYVEAAEQLVHRVATLAGMGPGARVLDVACGMAARM
jgi:hypothetical protein